MVRTLEGAAALILCLALPGAAMAQQVTPPPAAIATPEPGSAWADVADSLFAERPLIADDVVLVDAPYRAEDAAIVPVTIRTNLAPGDSRRVERLTLVIDENPSPVAATFTIGEGAGVSEIGTRVRVNAYSPVHVVAELSDGSLHVAEVFVKASGGCAAPASKDPEQALALLGRMKLRQYVEAAADPSAAKGPMSHAQAQLMIRHPNSSGLQMDQVTRYYIPAHFVTALTIRQGDALILSMEGGISISEDPTFRFDYLPNGAPISVKATDTDAKVFTQSWPAEAT